MCIYARNVRVVECLGGMKEGKVRVTVLSQYWWGEGEHGVLLVGLVVLTKEVG